MARDGLNLAWQIGIDWFNVRIKSFPIDIQNLPYKKKSPRLGEGSDFQSDILS